MSLNLEPGALSRKEIDGRLAVAGSAAVRRALVDCLAGEISPNVALARLLLQTGRVEAVEAALAEAAEGWGGEPSETLSELLRLLTEHREGCKKAATLLRDHPTEAGPLADPEEVLESARRFFDAAVLASEEASVAAYSLGSPALLEAATQEIVELFERWGLLGPDRVALEIGCGIGRVQAALSPRLAEVHGIDLSPEMINAARRRCAGLPNVHLAVSSGQDLSGFPAGRFDLVLAVDSLPYIHQVGPELVEDHFHEVVRVLRPGGDFALLNFSYRDDLAADQEDVEALCDETGLLLEVPGVEPFSLWDGTVFLCRKPGAR